MNLGQRLYDWVSPPTISLPVRLIILLDKMYPNIDWKNTPCYDGIPWFMRKSFAIGTALPSHFFSKKRGMYFRDPRQMSSRHFKSVLVHEAYHIQQYEDLSTPLDWGLNCSFMHHYFGLNLQYLFDGFFGKKMSRKEALRYAYRQHPMEVPAYNQEEQFRKAIHHFEAHEVGMFLRYFPSLKVRKSAVIPKPKGIFYLLGMLTSLLIAISRPLVESILLAIAITLGGRKKEATILW